MLLVDLFTLDFSKLNLGADCVVIYIVMLLRRWWWFDGGLRILGNFGRVRFLGEHRGVFNLVTMVSLESLCYLIFGVLFHSTDESLLEGVFGGEGTAATWVEEGLERGEGFDGEWILR